jgi:hypothetical protein
MKMYVDQSSRQHNALQLITEHNGEEIHWHVSTLNKTVFETDEVCRQINNYWAKQPMYKQQLIFDVYTKIKDVLVTVYDTTQLITQLVPLVAELYAEHSLDDMSTWISFHSDVVLPTDMVESYIKSDDDVRTREKTYIREDYKGLIVLSLALRPMIPIWGEFIYVTRNDTGTEFKEFYAVKLINKTQLIESEPMVKLKTYVSHNIKADKPMFRNILNSVGTENFPMWLLSHVLVRKLCISDLSCVNNEANLISSIFNFISQKITGNPPSTLADMVNSKDFARGNSNDENNISRLEAYKIKQVISPGDIEIIEHVLSDPYQIARLADPNIPMEHVKLFVDASRALDNHEISLCQVVLAQYILKDVIPSRGLMHVGKVKVINAIAAAQSVIWHKYRPIAAMMSAIVTADAELQTNGLDSKVRIPPDMVKELERVFPYTKVSISKKKGKVENSVLRAIDELTSLLSSRDWTITLPDHMAEQVTGQASLRRYSCPQDIKILLAQLILDIVVPKTTGSI